MSRTVIPKDCILCDVCNKQLSDENFIVSEDCEWYEGWLYCSDCDRKYQPYKEMKLIQSIKAGDDVSLTLLAEPIVLEGF